MKAQYALIPLPALSDDTAMAANRGAATGKTLVTPERGEEAKDTRKIGTLQLDTLLIRSSGEHDLPAKRKPPALQDTTGLIEFEDETVAVLPRESDSTGLEWLARPKPAPAPVESTARDEGEGLEEDESGVIALADDDVIYVEPLKEIATIERLETSADDFEDYNGLKQDIEQFVADLYTVEEAAGRHAPSAPADPVEAAEAAGIAELVQDGYLLNITLAQPKIIVLVALDGRPAAQVAEIGRNVKESEALRGTPTLALLSGRVARGEVEQQLLRLVDDVAVYPFNPPQLLEKIDGFLELDFSAAEREHVVVDLAHELVVQPLSASELLKELERLAAEQHATEAAPGASEGDQRAFDQLVQAKAGLVAARRRAVALEREILRHEDRLARLHQDLAACKTDLAATSEKLERPSN